jgi:hypothetical protein
MVHGQLGKPSDGHSLRARVKNSYSLIEEEEDLRLIHLPFFQFPHGRADGDVGDPGGASRISLASLPLAPQKCGASLWDFSTLPPLVAVLGEDGIGRAAGGEYPALWSRT